MDIFNRNGVAKHSLFLISSLIISIAVVFAVNLRISQKDSNAQLKLSKVEDFHSTEYVPLELGNIPIPHQETSSKAKVVIDEAVDNVADIAIEDVDNNNQVTFLTNYEKDEEVAKPALTTDITSKSTSIKSASMKSTSKSKSGSSKVISNVIRISNFPVKDGSLSSGFGMRKHPIYGNVRMHSGIDISAISGSKVQAMGKGTVVFAGRKSGYGNNIEIKHGNTVLTRYSHLKEILVEVGQKVTPEDVIGLVGNTGVSTGPHLHLEVALNETEVDPTIFLAGKATVASKPVKRQLAKASTKSELVASFDEVTYQDYLQSFDGLYGLVVPGQTN